MKTQIANRQSAMNGRNQEIAVWLIALVIFLALFSGQAKASNPPRFDEEEYVDDIPFSTEMVVHRLSLPAVDFKDEAYVEDIPFTTAVIVAQYKYKVAVAESFEMEEEAYVDDIPFNTVRIAEQSSS